MRITVPILGNDPARIGLPCWAEVAIDASGQPIGGPPGHLVIEVRDEDIPDDVKQWILDHPQVPILPPGQLARWRPYLDERYKEHAGQYARW